MIEGYWIVVYSDAYRLFVVSIDALGMSYCIIFMIAKGERVEITHIWLGVGSDSYWAADLVACPIWCPLQNKFNHYILQSSLVHLL